MQEQRDLRPVVAVLLSLVAIGLGQLYNGQPRRAFTVFFIWVAVVYCTSFALLNSFPGWILWVVLGLAGAIAIHINAGIGAKRIQSAPMRRFNRWYVYVIIALVVYLLLTVAKDSIPFKAYKVPSGGMKPGLEYGELFMATKRSYSPGDLRRGDIVVFVAPFGAHPLNLKRIVAVEGDEIEIRNKLLKINGEAVHEPHVIHADIHINPTRDNYGPFLVPPGKVFVLGDNRDDSHDSRYWGPLEFDAIRGRALYIYYSPHTDRIGLRLD